MTLMMESKDRKDKKKNLKYRISVKLCFFTAPTYLTSEPGQKFSSNTVQLLFFYCKNSQLFQVGGTLWGTVKF